MGIYVAWSIHEEEVPSWSDDYPDGYPGYAICPHCHSVMGYSEDQDAFICDCDKKIKLSDIESVAVWAPMRKPMCCVECGGSFPDCSDFCSIIANYVGE